MRANLKSVGAAKRGLVVDSVIQEVDIATGLVTFEWHSLGKIPITDTFSKPMSPRAPFDYAHANSVNLDTDGNLLLSARNTWTAYKINHDTGKIIWRLGGKHSTFKLPKAARFAWQHNVLRRASDGAITVFDNSAFPPVRKFSRALAIRLDEKARTASLISAAAHPKKLLTATQGNQQTLPNGNFLVGWGSQRQLTEFDPAGNAIFNAFLSLGYESYRAYRLPWVGQAADAAEGRRGRRAGRGHRRLHELERRDRGGDLGAVRGLERAHAEVGRHARRGAGFETKITAPGVPRFVQVRARDAAGNVLSTSAITRVNG